MRLPRPVGRIWIFLVARHRLECEVPSMHNDEIFMRRAIELARAGMNQGAGGPFGAVVVKDGDHRRRGLEPGARQQRPDRPRRNHRHPRRLREARNLLARWLRDPHHRPALPDVSRRDPLGADRRKSTMASGSRTRRRSASTTPSFSGKWRCRRSNGRFPRRNCAARRRWIWPANTPCCPENGTIDRGRREKSRKTLA